jgi:hypothetical protein
MVPGNQLQKTKMKHNKFTTAVFAVLFMVQAAHPGLQAAFWSD